MKSITYILLISATTFVSMNIQADGWNSSSMYKPSAKENVNPLYENKKDTATYAVTTGGKVTRMPQTEQWQSSPMYKNPVTERTNPFYQEAVRQ